MKGKRGDIAGSTVAYIIFILFFAVFIFNYLDAQQDGAAVWEDYYVKEIVRIIDFSSPGDEIDLDVTKGITIAIDNSVSKSEIFEFDNAENEVCVKLSQGRRSCMNFFNDVDVIFESGEDINFGILTLKIVEAVK